MYRNKQNLTINIIAIILLLLFSFENLYASKGALIYSKLGKNDSILVTNSQGDIVFSKNINKKLVPASILKLVTSLAAFHYLGDDYRFRTEFYTNEHNDLKIKGYGDPVLVSEELEKIAADLRKIKKNFNKIICDASFYKYPIKVPGITRTYNPYDAPNGALCVNFNTVCFKRDSKKRLHTAEPHTPLLPFAKSRITRRTPSGRINLFKGNDDIIFYVGHLANYFLTNQGIETSGIVNIGKVDKKDTLIYIHESGASLQEIVSMLLEFSNNFIANQLLLTIGGSVYGPPATLAKGARAINNYVINELKINNFHIVEGSGISRKNKVTASQMMTVLKKFKNYRHLLSKEDNQLYKTGTLRGVRTRSGYIKSETGDLYSFVVMMHKRGITTYNMKRVMKTLIEALP